MDSRHSVRPQFQEAKLWMEGGEVGIKGANVLFFLFCFFVCVCCFVRILTIRVARVKPYVGSEGRGQRDLMLGLGLEK